MNRRIALSVVMLVGLTACSATETTPPEPLASEDIEAPTPPESVEVDRPEPDLEPPETILPTPAPPEPATTRFGDYGSSQVLDEMYGDCAAGVWSQCDQLYFDSPVDSAYEHFGDTCGDRNPPAGLCTEVQGGLGQGEYGSDTALDALYGACAAGDFAACDELYVESPLDSEYEHFGDTCGDRNPPAGWCVDIHAST